MRFDTTALHRELSALPIVGCRSDPRADQAGLPDVDAIIDWLPGHPTAAERITAQAILTAHDPGKRERDRAAEDADRRDVLRQLSDAHRDFDTLGTAARWAAVKLLIRVVLALARRLLP